MDFDQLPRDYPAPQQESTPTLVTPPPPVVAVHSARAFVPPAPVGAAPNFAPSQPAPGSSVVKVLVISGVCAVVALAVVASLAIVALSALGSTASSQEAEPLSIEGSISTDAQASASTSGEMVVPVDAELYVGPDGGFSLMTSPSWGEPIFQPNPVTGGTSTVWILGPEFESPDFTSNINVSSLVVGQGVTLEELSAAEVAFARSTFEVSNVQESNRSIDGELVRELSLSGSNEGVEMEIYSVFHLEGDTYHLVTLAAPPEHAAELQASVQQHFLTLRTLRTFD